MKYKNKNKKIIERKIERQQIYVYSTDLFAPIHKFICVIRIKNERELSNHIKAFMSKFKSSKVSIQIQHFGV
jgi:hypothetical protein